MSCPRLEKNLKTVANLLVPCDMDWVTCIVGGEGMGKSTLAVYCAYAFQKYEREMGVELPELDFKKQAIYSPKQLKESALNLPKGSAVIVDEGALLLFNRKWQSQQSVDLNQILMTFRNRNLFTIFVIPVYMTTDVYLRNYRTNVILRVRGRFVEKEGKTVLQRGLFDSFTKRKHFMTGIDPKAEPYKWKLGFTEYFPDVSRLLPEKWAEYKGLSDLHKEDFLKSTLLAPKERKKREYAVEERKKGMDIPAEEQIWT